MVYTELIEVDTCLHHQLVSTCESKIIFSLGSLTGETNYSILRVGFMPRSRWPTENELSIFGGFLSHKVMTSLFCCLIFAFMYYLLFIYYFALWVLNIYYRFWFCYFKEFPEYAMRCSLRLYLFLVPFYGQFSFVSLILICF